MILSTWPKDQIQSYSNKYTYIILNLAFVHSRLRERSQFPVPNCFGNEPSVVASELRLKAFAENQQAELHSHRCDQYRIDEAGQPSSVFQAEPQGLGPVLEACVAYASPAGAKHCAPNKTPRAMFGCLDVEVDAISTIPWPQFAPRFTLVLVLASASFEAPFNGQIAQIQAT